MTSARTTGLRTALALLAATTLAPGLRAHAVSPTAITMPADGVDYVYVADGLACAAEIRALSTNPSAVQVFAMNMTTGGLLPGNGTSATVLNRVDQVFVVRAAAGVTAPASADIEICWIGADWPGTPCNENNCSPYGPVKVSVTIGADPASFGARLATGLSGDPVDTSTGELVLLEAPDLRLPGRHPLGFQRYYGSALLADGVAAGALGPNWRHNYDWSLATTGNAVEVTSPAGRVVRFENTFLDPTTWTLAVYQDAPYQLRRQGTDWLLADTIAQLVYTFDANGRLTRVEDRNGVAHALAYLAGRLDQVSDGRGWALTFSYGPSGELTSVSDGTRQVAFTYDGSGQLATATDAAGAVTTYGWDPAAPGAGRLASRTLPEGNTPWTQTFDGQGRVVTQTSADGQTSLFAYDPVSGDTTVTDPLGGTTVFRHTAAGELTSLTDAAGDAASAQYDALGRRTGVTDREGRTSTWSYDSGGGVAQTTAPGGAATTYQYADAVQSGFTFRDLIGVSHPDGTSESFARDARGNVTGFTDAAGGTWTWTYDAAGNALTSTNPRGAVTTLVWNADGTVASRTDDSGNTTAFGYDALGRATSVTLPDTSALSYSFDARDRVTSATDTAGATASWGYDLNGNLTSITDRAGGTWLLCYDAMDRLDSLADPLGGALSATYDELGRPATVTGATGGQQTRTYDGRGRLTALTDARGRVWSQSHTDEDALATRTDPLGGVTTYGTDARGRVDRITSPLGAMTRFTFDARGRLRQVRDPLNRTTSITWGPLARPTAVTIPGGAGCGYAYDALGARTGVTDPRGGLWASTFDAEGRRTSVADPLGNALAFQYDALDRIDHVDLPGGLGSVDFTFDAAGRPVLEAWSDGTSIAHAWDAAGRSLGGTGIALSRDAAGRLDATNGIAVGRDAAGRVTSLTLAPGKTVSYGYDAAGRVAAVTDWVGGTTSFAYDAAGRLTSVTRPNGLGTAYEYDADGWLTRVHDDDGAAGTLADHALVRDATGRLTQATRTTPASGLPALGSATWTHDAAHRIVSWTWDALGRATSDGVRAFTWDAASRLTDLTDGAGSVAYAYDAAGNVVSRTAGAATETYAWNLALALPSISVVRSGGTDRCYYVHTPDGLLLHAVDAATDARSYYHFDELGTTTFLSDDAAAVTDAWAHAPSGEELARTGTTRNPFTYLGQIGVFEEAAGLYRMRARLYDAAVERFLSRDPVEAGDPRGVNPYPYAYGNPLLWVDPLGTTPRIVGDLDTPTPIVTVDTRIVETADHFLDELGTDFRNLGGGTGPTGGLNLRGLGSPGSRGFTVDGTRIGGLNPVILKAIEVLERTTDPAAVVAEPRLVSLDGRAATIDVAQSLRIAQTGPLTASHASDVLSAPRTIVATGVQLTVTPTVSADRRFLTMELRPALVAPASALPFEHSRMLSKLGELDRERRRAAALRLPASVVRSLATAVSLPDGGTVVLGGIHQMALDDDAAGVPGLGRIPLVRFLFRRSDGPVRRSKLLVLITARVVDLTEN